MAVRSNPILDEDVAIIVTRALGPEIHVIDYNVQPYSRDVGGLSAVHYTLTVNIKKVDSSLQTCAFFVKSVGYFEPRPCEFLISNDDTFSEEVRYFVEIHPLLMKHYDGEPFAPKCWLANDKMIVLEDLTVVNYNVCEKSFLDVPSLKAVLSTLARFHGSSIIAESIVGKPLNQFHTNSFKEKQLSPSHKLFQQVSITLKTMAALAHYFGFGEINEAKLKNRLVQAVKPTSNNLNVICHGNLWKNNLMFSDSDPSKCVLIDYQMLRYASAGTDIAMILYLNCTPQLRKQIEIDMLTHYHSNLCETLASCANNVAVAIPTFNDIFEAYEEHKLVGLYYAAHFLPLVLLPSNGLKHLLRNPIELDKCLFANRIEFIMPNIEKNAEYATEIRKIVKELSEYSKSL